MISLPTRFAPAAACRWLSASSAMLMAAAAHADQVHIVGGGKLSGEVIRIRDGGTLELRSPISLEPLAVSGEAVRKVEFTSAGEPPMLTGNAQIHLANGDFLTASLLNYDRENGARIKADGMVEMNVSADHLRAIQFGVGPVKKVYEGPDDLANWTSDSRPRSQNWRFAGDRLTVDGAGQIGRMLNVPDHHVIRFTLNWQGQPNFQFGFSDPLEEQEVRVDRYFLQFGRAGLEIKRETSSGRRFHTIGILNRTPDQFRNRSVEIELRVDRAESVIHLAINGQPEGRFIDPFEDPPRAGGISLVSNASNGNIHEIRNLVVESWSEDTRQATRAIFQNRDSKRDELFIRQGDHYSGTLESIRQAGDDLLFILKVDFRDEPMEILGQDVAMVQFAAPVADEEAPPPSAIADLLLQLHETGSLQVTQSTFEGDTVSARHPLLGELVFPRSHISALERNIQKDPSDDS